MTPCVPYAWQEKGKVLTAESVKSKKMNIAGFMNKNNVLSAYISENNMNSEALTMKTGKLLLLILKMLLSISEKNIELILSEYLSDVARMLSEQAEIKIFLDENLTRKGVSKITSKFNDMPIETGIRRLLGPAVSSAFVFSKEKSESPEEQYRLDSVKIFEFTGSESPSPSENL